MFPAYHGSANTNRTASLRAGSDAYSGIAQLEERFAVNELVARSSRAPGAKMSLLSRMLAIPMLKRTGASNAGSFA